MYRFIVGVVAGALAAWYWADDIRQLETRTRRMRSKAADALQAVDERVEGFLDGAKEQVSTTLHAGQDAIRPPRRTD